MDSSVVAMLKGTNGKDLAYKALSAIDAGEVVSSKKKVLVKINITIIKTAADGVTIDEVKKDFKRTRSRWPWG